MKIFKQYKFCLICNIKEELPAKDYKKCNKCGSYYVLICGDIFIKRYINIIKRLKVKGNPLERG